MLKRLKQSWTLEGCYEENHSVGCDFLQKTRKIMEGRVKEVCERESHVKELKLSPTENCWIAQWFRYLLVEPEVGGSLPHCASLTRSWT